LLVLLVALLEVFGMKYPADPDHLRLAVENLSQLAASGANPARKNPPQLIGFWRQIC